MRRYVYEYDVNTVVYYTRVDLDILLRLSKAHYDTVCKQASQVGGFLYGMSTFLGFEEKDGRTEGDYRLTYRQLDTICKITEACDTPEETALHETVRQLLRESGEVYRTLNEEASNVG
jgi:hypothetical protein